MQPEPVDLVVVGAGFNGLCAAKTYLQVNPKASVLVYDASSTIGGVWAQDRLYPTLKANNLYRTNKGTFELGDFPASKLGLIKPGEHYSGEAIHQYLCAYADHFGLKSRIRLNCTVISAEKFGQEGWLLSIRSTEGEPGESSRQVRVRKLIIATGLFTTPYLPSFKGSHDFDAPLFHGKDLAKNMHNSSPPESVVVYGGGKMAWDAAYAYASAGKTTVHWVIREKGHGPAWIVPARVTPLKLLMEDLPMTRLVACISPCIWAARSGIEGFIRRFIHRTGLGRQIARSIFKIIRWDLCRLNRYDRCVDTKKLKPWIDPFWVATEHGILSYDKSIFHLVQSGRIQVYIDEIDHLSRGHVHLARSGSPVALPADAFICCSGWQHKPTISLLPETIQATFSKSNGSKETDNFSIQKADSQILTELPLLQSRPQDPIKSSDQIMRLYRFTAPPPPHMNQHNLAFAGFTYSFAGPTVAQAQALWITAYLDGRLTSLQGSSPLTSEEENRVSHETILHSQFLHLRYPWGYGAKYPEFVFEALPFLDMLLSDLGLTSWRKSKRGERTTHGRKGWIDWVTFGWFSKFRNQVRDLIEPYGPRDYDGLVEEWLATDVGASNS